MFYSSHLYWLRCGLADNYEQLPVSPHLSVTKIQMGELHTGRTGLNLYKFINTLAANFDIFMKTCIASKQLSHLIALRVATS